MTMMRLIVVALGSGTGSGRDFEAQKRTGPYQVAILDTTVMTTAAFDKMKRRGAR